MKEKKSFATVISVAIIALSSCMSDDSNCLLEESCLPNCTLQVNGGRDKQSIEQSRMLTERKFSSATGGYLLSYPLVFESDPSLFWLLVCDDSTKMQIDRVYLVDATHEFRFNRDIYSLDSVYYNPNEEEPFSVVVSGNNGIKKSYFIDGFMYHTILEINKNKYDFSSNIVIPVRKMPAIANMPEK